MRHGLGEKGLEPCSKEITNTKVAEGFMCMVTCIEAAALRVPDVNEVSKGMLAAKRLAVRILYSAKERISLFKIFCSSLPDSSVEICKSNIKHPLDLDHYMLDGKKWPIIM